MINFDILEEKKTIDRINIMIESSPVSSFETELETNKKFNHKENLSFDSMDRRLKDIFKRIDPEIFVDRLDQFQKIKKNLLKNHLVTESKLIDHLKGENTIKENCSHIKELLSE